MMRVLWFTNNPAIAADRLKRTYLGGGWMYALGNALKESNKITLGVAFYYDTRLDYFFEDGVSFYPIYSGLDKLKNRLLNKIILTDENKNDLNTFLKIIEIFNPDVIHIHGTEMPFIKIIGSTNKAVVVSLQGITTVYSHFYFRGINKSEIPKRDFKSMGIYNSHHMMHFLMMKKKAKREKDFLKKALYILGRTKWDKRVSSILAPQAKYYHNDRVLREDFYENSWNKSERKGKFVLYSTTTDRIFKGFETIVQAALLLKNNIGIDFEWKIGGISERSSLIDIVKKVINDDYPGKNIKLLGRIPARSIIREMKTSDVYVMASHIENSPNNLYEAMMLGMPCIATHAGGSISVLKDGLEGILIQDGDPWSMAGAIMELYHNKEKAIEYGKNARKTAIKRHNKEKIVNNIINIYEKIYTKSQR